MTRVEQDLVGYIPYWVDKPQAQVTEELASWSLETKRIPDPYFFPIRSDGKLLSPMTGELVENSIEKNSYLGQKEWIAFQRIQEWDKDAKTGVSFWISPPHRLRSKFTKVIASEIVDDELRGRQLFNRSIMLELDENQALELHRNLHLANGVISDLTSPEEVRSRPVFLNNQDGNWVKYLNINIEDEPIINMVRTGDDLKEKELALKNSGVIYDRLFLNKNIGFDDERVKSTITEARSMNYFGKYDSTCPTTAFELVFDVGAKLIRNCGACKASLNKFMRSGDTCDHCGGVYKGC